MDVDPNAVRLPPAMGLDQAFYRPPHAGCCRTPEWDEYCAASMPAWAHLTFSLELGSASPRRLTLPPSWLAHEETNTYSER